MKRALARGRLLPQSLSTDPRLGRLSLKAVALFPLMWVNCDDQGRITGDPDEIKYAVCANIEHITRQEVPDLLDELQEQKIILCYNSAKAKAIQMLDWWDANQKMQWSWPSPFPPPEGWTDHLRYKASAKEVVTENWPPAGSQLPLPGLSGELSGENTGERSGENPGENSGEDTGENSPGSPLTTPFNNKEEKEKRKEERGISPEDSGEYPPSLTADKSEILKEITLCFKYWWGHVDAQDIENVTPREPDAKESAQLRDMARDLSEAGGVPLGYIKQAFREAGVHEKFHISYVRRILLDWLPGSDQ